MKIIKNVLNVILSFVIIFAVFLLMGMNIIENKFLNKEYVFSKMEEIQFYEQVSREVQSGFEKYIYQSGLPEDTIKNLFTDELLRKDINILIDCFYEGTDISLSHEEVRKTLDTKIQEYLKSQNKELDVEGQKNIKKFEELIIKEYTENVNVSTTLYTKGHKVIVKVEEIVNKIGNWPKIVLMALILLVILINIKDLLVALNFLSISSLSIGILLKLGVSLIFTNIDFDNLLILAKSVSNLGANIAKENLYMISDVGNIFIVCGLVGVFVVAMLKKTDKKVKPIRRSINNKFKE